MNKRALESLVKCGALDSTGATRKRDARGALSSALSHGQRASDERLQRAELALRRRIEAKLEHHADPAREEFEKNELLRLEKETLGLYVSEHPLGGDRATSCGARPTRRSPSSSAGATARSSPSAGIVSALKQLTTKKGDPMVFLRLDDVIGSAEVVVFNSVYAASRELLRRRRRAGRQGADRPQGRRDEADRARGRRRSRRRPSGGRCGCKRRRAPGAGRAHPRARGAS